MTENNTEINNNIYKINSMPIISFDLCLQEKRKKKKVIQGIVVNIILRVSKV